MLLRAAAGNLLHLRSRYFFPLLIVGLLGLAQPATAQYGPPPSFDAPASVLLNTNPKTISPARLRDDIPNRPLDLVIPTIAGVYVLINDGSGVFTATAASPIAAGSIPESAAVGTLNPTTDSHLDIAVANFDSGDVSILLGDGLGGFPTKTDVCVNPGGCPSTTNHPFFVAIANLNADGFPDLVVSNEGANTVSVLLGDGTGGFTLSPIAYPVGAGPWGIAAADLNNDTFQDIVVTNFEGGQQGVGNNVSVLLGNGNGTFQAAVPYATTYGARSVAVTDIDADGTPDLVVGTSSGYVCILLGNGNGTFQAFAAYLVIDPLEGGTPWGVSVGDFNLDGKLDVAVANASEHLYGDPDAVFKVTVMSGNGTGTSTLQSPGTSFVAGAFPAYVGSGDFNGDGKDDLAATNFGGEDVSIYLNNLALSSDLGITKIKTSPATVVAGQNVVYTTTVTNAGPNSATLVSVADLTPSNLTFVSNTGSCTTAFPCALGTVKPGDTRVITSTYLVASDFTAGTTLDNTATVTTAATDPPANNSATASVTVTRSADLAINKTGPTNVNAGQNVAYTITVNNLGPSDADTVVVADTPPAGLNFVSNAGNCTTSFPCALGTVPAGQGRIITSTFNVPSSYSGSTSIQNTATVSAALTNPDPISGNNTASAPTTVGFSADLRISKTGPTTVVAGQNVVYTIVVNNDGPSAAAAVSVADTAPAGLVFVSNTGACTNDFPCSLGSLDNGQQRTITSTFLVPSNYTGASPIQNTASVASGSTFDPAIGNNTSATVSTTVSRSADLTITKTGPANVNAGQNAVYTITVTNTGPSDAEGVSVADATPAGLTFVSNTGACTTAFNCALGTVPSGESRVITTTFSVPSGYPGANPFSNTATVTSTTADPTLPNTASAVTTVDFSADLSVSKTGPASVILGDNVVYTITVTNNGPSNSGVVTVADPTPAGLTFVSNTGDCTGTFPCALPPMTAGQVRTITSTFLVPLAYAGVNPIQNAASVSSATTDPVAANNSSTASTGVGAASADLSITKTGPANVFRGSSVVYTITVTNNGPTDAAGVSVADPTPSGLTFVSNTGDCTTAFPCALGSIQAAATRTITATFDIPPGYAGPAPVVNTATVSATSPDPDSTNDSASASGRLDPLSLNTVAPCRAVDTRAPGAGGPLAARATRTFVIAGTCNVPSTARAVSVNITVTEPTVAGDLRLFPAGATPPLASAINFVAGQTRANSAVIPLGPTGGIDVLNDQATGTVEFILDVNAYFEPEP